ncbi:TPA: AAA family ATPase [Enterococcus faecalis]|uniref:ATP-binding protein n=1 Tax=Enterococcus sp. DIV0086 TaxID=2774655 RepID=UPI0029874087|nr:AAA family ATPase [Enterococcus faecalis]HBI1662535.1 AAA family ATPase [Enterococcus faecalis]HBI1677698.1 AAA family ATPase [Enterococcus faecalis]HBI1678250.1 AAA family ATPase [Enterococcus faecalis]HBI1686286.1 AAA family ATPase [Enterococcus faecalis]
MKYILLAGIHGVGKSTLLDQIEKVYPIEAYTISSLIKKADQQIDTSNKQTKEITENQNLWKKELKKIDSLSPKIILDGHFTLLNNTGEIVPLPFETFENVDIVGIVLKKEIPEVIQSRLFNRDNHAWELERIQEFQEVEENTVRSYSLNAKIPLFVYDNTNQFDDLINFIDER